METNFIVIEYYLLIDNKSNKIEIEIMYIM